MARGYTTRKLEVFSFQAQSGKGPVDLAAICRGIGGEPANARHRSDGDKAVAIMTFEIEEDRVWFVACEGPEGQFPLIFDRASSTVRVDRLSKGEIVVTMTHGILSTKRREAIVEYNHRGAKAGDIADVMSDVAGRVGKKGWIRIDFNPKADKTFMEDLKRFGRIRLASVKMALPNPGWSDYKGQITKIASDSEAQVISVEVSAGRGEGISANKGLIAFIRDAIRSSTSSVKGAKVTGYREDEEAAATISLANHIEHQRVEVRMTPEGHVDSDDIKRKLEAFADVRWTSGG